MYGLFLFIYNISEPSMSKRISKNILLSGMVISMLIWGLSWPSAKLLTNVAPPLIIALIRFSLTCCSVFLILKFFKVPLAIKKEGYKYVAIASVLMAGYSMLFFIGIKHGTPGAGGVLVTTLTPIITYFLAMLLAKRKPTRKEIYGLTLGIIGGICLLKVWTNFENILLSGNLLFICSSFTWAILSRFTSQSFKYGSPLTYTFWMYLFCTIILLFFVNLPQTITVIQNGDYKFWGNMIFNSVVNTGMATMFYFYATSQLGAERTSSFIYIVPFAAAIASYFIMGEVLSWNTIIGGLLGICAVSILNAKKKIKLN
jgi:drug/metabolite transporter (DMT)-like permease